MYVQNIIPGEHCIISNFLGVKHDLDNYAKIIIFMLVMFEI